MAASDVAFSVREEKIELDSYTDEAILDDLVRGLEAFRLSTTLKTSRCEGCGECCHQSIPVLGLDIDPLARALETSRARVVSDRLILPESHPTAAERKRAIVEISRSMKMTGGQAAAVYDYNNSEPAIMRTRDDGACGFLQDGSCTIYDSRPLACRIYLCAMGDALSILHENIVRQGTSHLYRALGWIGDEDVAANPFAGAGGWEGVPIRAFAADDIEAAEKLFFYF